MRIFLDMDGVLADFYGGICQEFGIDPWPYKPPVGDWNFYVHSPLDRTTEEIAPLMDSRFYSNLKLLPDAHQIVQETERQVGPSNVYLLTSPWDTPGCFDGKLAWVKKHFPNYARRMLVGSAKEACAHPGAFLVDDSETNCNAFIGQGGKAILVPRPWNKAHKSSSLENGESFSRFTYFFFS